MLRVGRTIFIFSLLTASSFLGCAGGEDEASELTEDSAASLVSKVTIAGNQDSSSQSEKVLTADCHLGAFAACSYANTPVYLAQKPVDGTHRCMPCAPLHNPDTTDVQSCSSTNDWTWTQFTNNCGGTNVTDCSNDAFCSYYAAADYDWDLHWEACDTVEGSTAPVTAAARHDYCCALPQFENNDRCL
jgi:hypothetical protein